jgi:RNA polymerase sigma-70 factor (ECF subfamily)
MDKGSLMPTDEESRLFEDMMACQDAIFRICLGFTRNPASAEDLCQDIYLRAYSRLGGLRRASSAREWLFRIARTVCLDHAKKARFLKSSGNTLRPGDILDKRTPETEAVTKECQSLLKTAISGLPKKQREVFVLREYGHLSYDELSRVLGVKAGTIMSRLNRARAAVARRVREGGA